MTENQAKRLVQARAVARTLANDYATGDAYADGLLHAKADAVEHAIFDVFNYAASFQSDSVAKRNMGALKYAPVG